MNKQSLKSCFILLGVFFFYAETNAQREQEEQITFFSSRRKNPITVDVERQNDQIIFYGVNNSFLPYQVELVFKDMVNLDPYMQSHKGVLYQGRTKLLTLRVRDKGASVNYGYSIRYAMGNPKEKPDTDFPYLVPLGKNKTVGLNKVRMLNGGAAPGLFAIATGDTIFAMRKGRVTAVPADDGETDRITKASIEIYQGDGTIASYYALDLKSLVIPGSIVYPGQPVGVVGGEGVLRTYVFQFSENGKVQSAPVQYAVDSNTLVTTDRLNGVTCAHPKEIIIKELSKSEIKKLEKGTLY